MSSILIRRANMVAAGSNPGRLPAGYTELAYIESTGAQRLSLGFSGNANFELTAQSSVQTTSSSILICSTNGTGGTWIGGLSNGNWGAGTSSSSNYVNTNATTKAEIAVNFVNGTASGTVNGISFSRTASATNGQWSLFKANDGNYPFKGKMWGLKAYQSDALVAELVPAMRDSDSVVGMYDLVRNTFLTNVGSGTFNYGTL